MIEFSEGLAQDTESYLVEDLRNGKLCLEAMQPVAPDRFGFSIGDHCVGLYSVVSVDQNTVALTRAWNVLDSTFDVFRGLWVPVDKTRQFWRLAPRKPLFLVRLALDADIVTDKVAFTFSNCQLVDLARGDTRFERAILQGVEVLGG